MAGSTPRERAQCNFAAPHRKLPLPGPDAVPPVPGAGEPWSRRGVSAVIDFQIAEGNLPMLGTILIVVLLLLLLGAWPSWPHSRSWGYYPSGTLGLVLVIVLVLALMGRI